MKTLQNPTTFFFKQAENIKDEHLPEIQQFVKKLLNKDQCQLCKKDYDLLTRLPRIMIHCGHTFCTPCLKQFYMNKRVRCPMCLKLVKHIDSIERIPLNHTIYTHLVEKDKIICQKTGINPYVTDPQKKLFSQFQRVQKEALTKQNPQKIDPQSGLPFCVFHPDRVQHFFCTTHKSAGCRVCSQIGHSKPDCKVVDMYQIDDPKKLHQMMDVGVRVQEQDDSEIIPKFKGGELGVNAMGRLYDGQGEIENIDLSDSDQQGNEQDD